MTPSPSPDPDIRPLRRWLSAGLLATISSVAGAASPSFDCTKAVRDAERTICENTSLGEIDARSSALYRRLMDTVHVELRKSLQRTQLDFLRDRNDCRANVPCLESAYLFRYVELCGIAKLYGRSCTGESRPPN